MALSSYRISSATSIIQFTMEIESGSVIAFLDALVIRKDTTLATEVYRKRTHAG
jgi:hypothetical protein